jgi:hypothetical protein
MYEAAFIDDPRAGFWAVCSDEGRIVLGDLTREQAEYGSTILNSDGLGLGDTDPEDWPTDLLYPMVLYTNCVACERTFMQGTLDASKRCVDCQP